MILKSLEAKQEGRHPAIFYTRFAYIQRGAAEHGEVVHVCPALEGQTIEAIPALMHGTAHQAPLVRELSDHIVASFTSEEYRKLCPAGSERPPIRWQQAFVERILMSQGYEPSLSLYCWAWHKEEDQPHLHVLACRVHPASGKAPRERQPIRSLEREGLLIAHELGLDHRPGRNSRLLLADLVEKSAREVPLAPLRTLREFVEPGRDNRLTGTWVWRQEPVVRRALDRAGSWQEVHLNLGEAGLRLERVKKDVVEGRQTWGGIVREAYGRGPDIMPRRAKLSRFGHSLPRLEVKLGPFESPQPFSLSVAQTRCRLAQRDEAVDRDKRRQKARDDRQRAALVDPRELAARLLYEEDRKATEERYRLAREAERQAARRARTERLKAIKADKEAWQRAATAVMGRDAARAFGAAVKETGKALASAAYTDVPGRTPKPAMPPYRHIRQVYLDRVGPLRANSSVKWWPASIKAPEIAAFSLAYASDERAAIRSGTTPAGLRLRQELVALAVCPHLAPAEWCRAVRAPDDHRAAPRQRPDPTPGVSMRHMARALGQLSSAERRKLAVGEGRADFDNGVARRFLSELHKHDVDDLRKSMKVLHGGGLPFHGGAGPLRDPACWSDACAVALAQAVLTHPRRDGVPPYREQDILRWRERLPSLEKRRLAKLTPPPGDLSTFVSGIVNHGLSADTIYLPALREISERASSPEQPHRPLQHLVGPLVLVEQRIFDFEVAARGLRWAAQHFEGKRPDTFQAVQACLTVDVLSVARGQAEALRLAARAHSRDFEGSIKPDAPGFLERRAVGQEAEKFEKTVTDLAGSLRSVSRLPKGAAQRIRSAAETAELAVAWIPAAPRWNLPEVGGRVAKALTALRLTHLAPEIGRSMIPITRTEGWGDDERRRFTRRVEEAVAPAPAPTQTPPTQQVQQKTRQFPQAQSSSQEFSNHGFRQSRSR